MKTGTPTSIEVKVSYVCKIECEFCLFGDKRDWPEMTTRMIHDNLAHHVREYRVREFVLSGGEPTDREDLLEVLDQSDLLGIEEVYIHTNATNPLYNIRDKTSQYLTRVMVSYHSVGGHSDTTDELIQFWLNQGIRLRTNTLVLATSIREIPNIIEHVSRLGVHRMLFTYPFPLGFCRDGENPLLVRSSTVLYETVSLISRLCELIGMEYTFQGFPLCFLYPYHERIDPWIDRYVVDYYHQFENHQRLFDELLDRKFTGPCEECAKRDKCNGFWPESWHRSVFELRPFKHGSR